LHLFSRDERVRNGVAALGFSNIEAHTSWLSYDRCFGRRLVTNSLLRVSTVRMHTVHRPVCKGSIEEQLTLKDVMQLP